MEQRESKVEQGENMKRTCGILSIIITTVALVLSVGCETIINTRYVSAPPTYKDEYIEITARFLGEQDLIERYNRKNPFIAPPRVLTKFEFQVFELYIESSQELDTPINLQDIQLTFGSESVFPMPTSALVTFWRREIETYDPSRVTPGYAAIIRRALLPYRIEPPALGLVVFQGNFPLEGKAKLRIPNPTSASAPIELGFDYSYTSERRPFNPFAGFEEL